MGLLAGPPVWGDGGATPRREGSGTVKPAVMGVMGKVGKHPTDADKLKMITDGGASMGHSTAMPAWGGVLDKQAILEFLKKR